MWPISVTVHCVTYRSRAPDTTKLRAAWLWETASSLTGTLMWEPGILIHHFEEINFQTIFFVLKTEHGSCSTAAHLLFIYTGNHLNTVIYKRSGLCPVVGCDLRPMTELKVVPSPTEGRYNPQTGHSPDPERPQQSPMWEQEPHCRWCVFGWFPANESACDRWTGSPNPKIWDNATVLSFLCDSSVGNSHASLLKWAWLGAYSVPKNWNFRLGILI